MKRFVILALGLICLASASGSCSDGNKDTTSFDLEQEIENSQGEDITDSLISDVKKAAGRFKNVIEDVSIKKFMNDYFEAVREGNIDGIGNYTTEKYWDLSAELIYYQSYAYVYPQHDDYMPLFEEILDFSYKLSDVSFLNQNKVKVKAKVSNVDAFRAAGKAIAGRSRDELTDGGMFRILEQQMKKKQDHISASVVFKLKKKGDGWVITKIEHADELVNVVSGNLNKITQSTD